MAEEIVELYGMKLKVVVDNDVVCGKCALKDLNVCHPQACKDSGGETNRHFELMG